MEKFIKGSVIIRPERIFTADKNIILKTVGIVSHEIINETIDNIINILKQ